MFKIISGWLFVLATIVDIVLIVLKCAGWLSWGWGILIFMPFAVAIAGTLAFGVFYLLVKIFVSIALRF